MRQQDFFRNGSGSVARVTGYWGLWLLLLVSAARLQAAEESPAKKESPWTRVVMIGASATAGYTAGETFGGTNTPRHKLSLFLDAALTAPHEPVRNFSHALFFLQPEGGGKTQVEEALEAKPTLVVAVDFLFWFCYGIVRGDEARLQRFEQGLKLLESFSCPLIVGDIPDASAALVTGMLKTNQMPSAAVMKSANERLKAWAASRKQVAVVPLADFMRGATANQPLTLHGRTFPEGKTRAFLQNDRLHPSSHGAAVLALAILDAFQAKNPGVSATDVRWDPVEVRRLGLQSLTNAALSRVIAAPVTDK
jgi:lysophospholipase L1-like esterase